MPAVGPRNTMLRVQSLSRQSRGTGKTSQLWLKGVTDTIGLARGVKYNRLQSMDVRKRAEAPYEAIFLFLDM